MSKELQNAVASFEKIADMGSLSRYELFLLDNARKGSEKAFSDLLLHEGYENKPEFQAFRHGAPSPSAETAATAVTKSAAPSKEKAVRPASQQPDLFPTLSDNGKREAASIQAVLSSFFNSRKLQFTDAELSVFAEEIAYEGFTVSLKDKEKNLVTTNPNVDGEPSWSCTNTPKGRLAFVSDLLETHKELRHNSEANRNILEKVKARLEEHCRKLAELKNDREQGR